MGHLALKSIFFPNFFAQKFFKFSRHADLRGFGVAACENVAASGGGVHHCFWVT